MVRDFLKKIKSIVFPKYKVIGDKSNLFLSKDVRFRGNVIFDLRLGGVIKVGENTVLHEGVILESHGGFIEIGNNCSVNPYCVLYGHGGLKIGNYVRIATHSVFIPSNHNYIDKNVFIHFQGSTNLGIVIEDDVWIGCGSRILDGVSIGRGVVIGAGSVVSKSLESYGVYVGVPAKKINSRV